MFTSGKLLLFTTGKLSKRVIFIKVIMREIEMIALTNIKGEHTPILFYLEDNKGIKHKHKIKSVVNRELVRIRGKRVFLYDCIGEVNGVEKLLQVRFHADSCKWILFKI